VELLDGSTGESRWRCRLSRADGGPMGSPLLGYESARYLVAPDLDGDGCRDVLTAALIRASTFGTPESNPEEILLVAAISGRDGRILWRKLLPLRAQESLVFDELAQLKEWRHGRDGKPQLIVGYTGWRRNESNYYGDQRQKVSRQFVFAMSSGELTHVGDGLVSLDPVDLNGDGLADLCALRLDRSGLKA